MMVKYVTRGVTGLLIAVGVSACVNMGAVHIKQLHNYQLTTSESDTSMRGWPKLKRSVAIREGFIAPSLRGMTIAYQVNAYEVNYFVESRWQSFPSTMIVTALAKTLDSSGVFNAVVIAPPYVGPVDQEVTVNLLNLVQVFTADLKDSSEHLTVQLALSNGRTGYLQSVKTFDITVKAGRTPESGVIAANQALQQMLPEMLKVIYQTDNSEGKHHVD